MSAATQPELWKRVMAQVADDRLPQALLLAGPRGAGKLAFAKDLSAYLACEATTGTKPCGECRGCTQRIAGTHPNLMLLAPEEDKRDIAIEDIRTLLERLALSSHYGGKKVAIIAPADALNPSGMNALLKTVEEPPKDTHIILVSERWRALGATLRSRCQILRFATRGRAKDPAAEEAVAQWARALADLAQGRFAALAQVQGLKRDGAQAVLEAFLAVGTRWLQGLAVPAKARATGVPAGVTAESVQALLDNTFEGLKTIDRASAVLTLESIMIRWAGSNRG